MPDEIKPDHEWGKLSKGQPYNLIARDLDRAFAAASTYMRGYSAMILTLLRERSWAASIRSRPTKSIWPDPIPAKLCYRQIGRETGVHFANIRRDAKWLIDARIVTFNAKDSTFLINKNVDDWVRPGTAEPLLSQELRGWAKQASATANRSSSVVQPDYTPVVQPDYTSKSNQTTEAPPEVQPDYTPKSNQTTPRSPTGLHPVVQPDYTSYGTGARRGRAPEKLKRNNPPNPLRGDRTAPKGVGEDPDPDSDRHAKPAAKAEPEFPPRPTDRAAYFKSIFGEEAGKRLKGGGDGGR